MVPGRRAGRHAAGILPMVALVVVAACAGPVSSSPGPVATPTAVSRSSSAASGAPQPTTASSPTATPEPIIQTYAVPGGSQPHDVAPAIDGGVWYVAQATGRLGWLDPGTGGVNEIALGGSSAPHGVIVGPDGAPWITDGGLNAIVRVDPETEAVELWALPETAPDANLNTATFDGEGVLWFTGQAGIYGRLDLRSNEVAVYPAPRGAGPYGIATTPDGDVYLASLAGSYLGAIDGSSRNVTVIDTPTPGGGARRVWSDSAGRLWVTEWFAGNLAMYDPANESWREWHLPGDGPMPYAVYVDETDAVWITDFGANALVRFDPVSETFQAFPHHSSPAEVRQLLGREGEVWGAESAADQLVVVRLAD